MLNVGVVDLSSGNEREHQSQVRSQSQLNVNYFT